LALTTNNPQPTTGQRLGVARNLRWDWCGLVALVLMLVPGYPIVFFYLFLILTGIFGPIFGNR
jgi:hypothetical protein